MSQFLFRILLFLILAIGSASLWKGWRTPGYGNPYLRTKLQAWDSRPAATDRLVLGSSRAYRGIVPALLDSLSVGLPGTRTMNLAAPALSEGQVLSFAEKLIHDERRSQRIRTLIIELQDIGPIEGDIASQVRETYWHTIAEWWFTARCMIESDRRSTTKLVVLVDHALATFRSALAVGELDDLLQLPDTRVSDAVLGPLKDGFASLDREVDLFPDASVRTGLEQRRAELLDRPDQLDTLAQEAVRSHQGPKVVPATAHVERLLDLIRSCDERRIAVLFVLPPRSTRPYPLAVLKELPKQLQIDLSDPRRYPDLYDIRYSFDLGHLNQAGAERMTRHLVEAWQEVSIQAGPGRIPAAAPSRP